MNLKIRPLLLCLTALSFLATSCRFGNHSDAPTFTGKSQFKNTELFFSEIRKFETFAFYTDGTNSTNATAPLVSIPSHLLNTFTNPVYWTTIDDKNQTQIFMDNYQTEFEQTLVDASGNIKIEIDSAISPLISNSICRTQLQNIQEGSLDRTAPGTALLTGNPTRVAVAGKLKLSYTSIRALEGDCADSLRELANCYQNGTGCTNEQLTEAHALFDLYVRGTGVLKIEDAYKLKGLAYIVHFD